MSFRTAVPERPADQSIGAVHVVLVPLVGFTSSVRGDEILCEVLQAVGNTGAALFGTLSLVFEQDYNLVATVGAGGLEVTMPNLVGYRPHVVVRDLPPTPLLGYWTPEATADATATLLRTGIRTFTVYTEENGYYDLRFLCTLHAG